MSDENDSWFKPFGFDPGKFAADALKTVENTATAVVQGAKVMVQKAEGGGVSNVEGQRGGELKRAVLAQYGTEHSDLIKDIDQKLVKLDVILEKLDTKLADSLAKAHAAANDAARRAELKISKTILADYIKNVKSEPLIAHIDSNPFGVKTSLKPILTGHLTHMAQSIG